MPATINQKLCMSPTGRMPVIHVGQYDSDFSIVFSLYSAGNATWTMESGTTAKIRGTKTDGTGYSADCTNVDVTNKKVTVAGDQQMTAAAGDCIYEIVLYKGSKELSSVNFILNVERAAMDAGTIQSESKIQEIQEIGTKADEIIEAYENLQFDDTPTTNSTHAVKSGGIKSYVDTTVNTVTENAFLDIRSMVTGGLFASRIKIEQGKYAYADGRKAETNVWCRTTGYIPSDISLYCSNGVQFKPVAFDALSGEYVGEWNGNTFSTTYARGICLTRFNCSEWLRRYPNYVFALSFTYDATRDITPTDVYSASSVANYVSDKIRSFDDEVDTLNNLINYEASGSVFGNVNGTEAQFDSGRFYINGYQTSYGVLRLTTELAVAQQTAITGFSHGITLVPGKRYRVKSTTVRGERIGSDGTTRAGVSISVYPVGSDTSMGTFVYDSTTFTRDFVATDSEINICIYINKNNTYNACEGIVTLELLDIPEEDDTDVKSYYLEELEDTIDKVRNISDEPSLIFPCVTDLHRYKASVQTFPDMVNNMRYFAERVKCDFLLDTGDTIEGDQQQTTSLDQAYDCLKLLRSVGIPVLYVNGNHDNNPYVDNNRLTFNLKQVYKGFFTSTKDVVFNENENGTDYYFDFNGLGIRFISLNSCNCTIAVNYGFGHSTGTWLTEALNTDKLVIIGSHVSPIKEHVWNNIDSNAGDVRTALSNFVSGGGELILITGHSHVDAEFVDPYCEITNICQKFEMIDTSATQWVKITGEIDTLRVPERVENTHTADAWSVAVVKPLSKEINFIRFGAGVDRYIHYLAISPTTVTSRFDNPSWYTSNSSIATVSNGVISGVGNGRCAIIAKDDTGNMEIWIVEI